jgi:hypothetical protein
MLIYLSLHPIQPLICKKTETEKFILFLRNCSLLKQEVLERTNLPTFQTLFKNVMCIKTSVCPNITLVGNAVPIFKHSHIQNNVSNKRIVGSS